MLTQLIALLALTTLGIMTTLGSYWFVFGLWPQSWLAFLFFGCAHLLITGLITTVSKQKS